MSKIKNDIIKILFNLNIVVSILMKKKNRHDNTNKDYKKLEEMKNVLVDLEKNLNIVMEVSKLNFLNEAKALALAFMNNDWIRIVNTYF